MKSTIEGIAFDRPWAVDLGFYIDTWDHGFQALGYVYFITYYLPRTSFHGKVMFLQASVCLSTGGIPV